MDSIIEKESTKMEVVDSGLSNVYMRLYDLDGYEAIIQSVAHLLSSEEQIKSDRFFKQIHKDRYILTRAFTRIFLSEISGVSAASLKFSKSQFGKPILDNVSIPFSISHSENYLLLSATERGNIGCDIESSKNIDISDVTEIATKIASTKEMNRMIECEGEARKRYASNLWVKKEAWLKALGLGFMAEPKKYCTESFDAVTPKAHLSRVYSNQIESSLLMALCHIA